MKPYRHFQITAISFALIFVSYAPTYGQATQNHPAPSAQIQKVKDEVQKIGSGGEVSVIMFSGLEYYGSISKIEADSFEIDEVDLKQMVSIDYTNVKKVERGYGRMNSSTGTRHKKSHSRLILFLVGLGAVVGMTAFGLSRLGNHSTPPTPPPPTLPNPPNPLPFPRIP